MKVLRAFQIKAALLAVPCLFAANASFSYPDHDPNVFDGGNLWSITYYHDTSTTHTEWATQRICFQPYASPGAGQTNISGRWYSTSYPNWHGHYQQEGDTVKMTGNFWRGRGNDSMIWDIATSSRRNIGTGHWLEFGDDGMNGPVYGMGNTLLQRVGSCRMIVKPGATDQVQLPDVKPRLLRDGSEAQYPMQEGQLPLEGANNLEELFDDKQ